MPIGNSQLTIAIQVHFIGACTGVDRIGQRIDVRRIY